MTESHRLLMTSLTSYYNQHPEHRQVLKEVVNGASKMSLRVLDWFVTHYAKKRQLVYFIDDIKGTYSTTTVGPTMRKFNVYLEYRAQLQSYTKLFFDSFRRHERVTFLDPVDNSTFESTVGQLNFFRWACKNHVINFVYDNLQEIEHAMQEYQKTTRSHYNSPTPCTVSGTIFVTFD